ncbi:50S ribosomal protein L35 [bacterium]|nr:50S ribosomal protein L35 [bacterium]
MPKLKTKKAIAKRFKITKRKKFVHRTCGQNHFNARESGKITRNKRRNKNLAKGDQKVIKRALGQ